MKSQINKKYRLHLKIQRKEGVLLNQSTSKLAGPLSASS